MLLAFLYTLRALKVPVGTQEWIALMEALSKDLTDSSLTRFYSIARSILVKSEALYDAFDEAFLICFKGKEEEFDIKKELYEWLRRSVDPAERPKLPKLPPLDLEELRRLFRERLKEQMEEHHGGDRWIGTGGYSPWGHSGAHPSGIRVGGPGGGRSAVQVAEERRFQNYRHDRILDTRQLQVALKRLRKLDRVGPEDELQLDETIDQTARNGGEIELIFGSPKKNISKLLLLMDTGGSMDPYAELVETLFSAAHASKHFKAFHYFYFHNCIYSRVYTDMSQGKSMATHELFRKYDKEFRVVIVGDACMSPYELIYPGGAIDYWENNRRPGIEWLRRFKQHYPWSVWLNPQEESTWHHPTIRAIEKIFRMFPLTVEGITDAVDHLRAMKREVPVVADPEEGGLSPAGSWMM